jgi:hypothetical protein
VLLEAGRRLPLQLGVHLQELRQVQAAVAVGVPLVKDLQHRPAARRGSFAAGDVDEIAELEGAENDVLARVPEESRREIVVCVGRRWWWWRRRLLQAVRLLVRLLWVLVLLWYATPLLVLREVVVLPRLLPLRLAQLPAVAEAIGGGEVTEAIEAAEAWSP